MSTPASPTLDQLRVLIAVADSGSFSAAARCLGRTQSVVSYTVANLEAQLGLAVFERGHRRARLTEAGRAVLGDARRVAWASDALRARAISLTRGTEAELALAVDVMFPTARLVALLEAFAANFPTVALRLRIEALGGVAQLLLDRVCTLGISGWLGHRFDMFERRAIPGVELIPVAAPMHPLARAVGSLGAADLRDHTQLVLTDRTELTAGQDFGVASPHTWRLGDLGAKHELLRAGIGWGNMPAHVVGEDLAAGRLVRLSMREAPSETYRLMLLHRLDTPPGPAARWLAGQIAGAEACPPAEKNLTPSDAASPEPKSPRPPAVPRPAAAIRRTR
jgi:DNA-binding transcriptional LysR family regulator